MMKKFLALMLSVSMLAGLAACGSKETEAPAEAPAQTEAPAETEPSVEEEAAEAVEEEAAAPDIEEILEAED